MFNIVAQYIPNPITYALQAGFHTFPNLYADPKLTETEAEMTKEVGPLLQEMGIRSDLFMKEDKESRAYGTNFFTWGKAYVEIKKDLREADPEYPTDG